MKSRSIAAILLSTVLAAPVASFAAPQHGDRDDRDRRELRNDQRVYDPEYRDYHVWSDQEQRLYREYLDEHHMRDRAYSELSARQQRNYWKWRHEHDRDQNRDRDRDRDQDRDRR